MNEAFKKAVDKASELLAKREILNECNFHDVDRLCVIEAMMDYAEYCLNGKLSQLNKKPQTLTSLWGLMKDRTCTNSCSVVCGECQILHISADCEEVKNWDSFVEQKNKELLAEEYANSKSSSEVFREAHKKDFIEGYNKAKKTLYTREQVMNAIRLARQVSYCNADYEIITSLKLK